MRRALKDQFYRLALTGIASPKLPLLTDTF